MIQYCDYCIKQNFDVALQKAGIAEQFLTVGTNAIYAYERACGVRMGNEAMATRDMDLLFDTPQRTAFVSTLHRLDSSLLAVLRKADPSFRVLRARLAARRQCASKATNNRRGWPV